MRAFQELPIKRQLMLLIMLTSGVVMLLACAGFVIYDQVIFRRNMKRDLDMLAEVIGANNRGALMFNRPENAEKSLATLKAVPHIVSARLYLTNGAPFATYTNNTFKGETQPPPEALAEGPPYFDKGRLQLFHSIRLGEDWFGTIFLQSSLTELYTPLPL